MTREEIAIEFINSLLRGPILPECDIKSDTQAVKAIVNTAYALADAVIARRSPTAQ